MEKRVRFSDKPPDRKKTSQSLPYKKPKGTQSLPSKKPKVPSKAPVNISLLRKICGMVIGAVRTALVACVTCLQPRSTLRWRQVRNEFM